MLSLRYDDWVHFKMWISAEVLGEVRIRFGRSFEGRLLGSIPNYWKVETGTL